MIPFSFAESALYDYANIQNARHSDHDNAGNVCNTGYSGKDNRIIMYCVSIGNIKYISPNRFYEAFMSNGMRIKEFSA